MNLICGNYRGHRQSRVVVRVENFENFSLKTKLLGTCFFFSQTLALDTANVQIISVRRENHKISSLSCLIFIPHYFDCSLTFVSVLLTFLLDCSCFGPSKIVPITRLVIG